MDLQPLCKSPSEPRATAGPSRAVWPGQPTLAARRDGEGVNFSLFSTNADKVELVHL